MDVFSSIECDTILSHLLVALKLWPKVEREDVSKKNRINVHLIYLVQANFSVNNIQKHSVIALYICLIKIFFIFLYFSTICMPKLLEFYLIFKKLNPTVRLFTFFPPKKPFFRILPFIEFSDIKEQQFSTKTLYLVLHELIHL